jgi:hypothetical protein
MQDRRAGPPQAARHAATPVRHELAQGTWATAGAAATPTINATTAL